LLHGSGTIPEKVGGDDDGGRERTGRSVVRGWKRRGEEDEVLALVSSLDAKAVALPGEAQIGLAAVPGVRAGEDVFVVAALAADQNVGKKKFMPYGVVVFEPDVDGEALGK
jgi:hypothetical protein